MKKTIIVMVAALAMTAYAQRPMDADVIALNAEEAYPAKPTAEVLVHEGKKIYIPEDLRKMDLNDPASKWSFHRMVETPDIALFWADGFGDNIAAAPDS